MRAELFRRSVIARQLRLRQRRVDFVMADLMDEDRRPALSAFQLRHEMMKRLFGLGRNGPAA